MTVAELSPIFQRAVRKKIDRTVLPLVICRFDYCIAARLYHNWHCAFASYVCKWTVYLCELVPMFTERTPKVNQFGTSTPSLPHTPILFDPRRYRSNEHVGYHTAGIACPLIGIFFVIQRKRPRPSCLQQKFCELLFFLSFRLLLISPRASRRIINGLLLWVSFTLDTVSSALWKFRTVDSDNK